MLHSEVPRRYLAVWPSVVHRTHRVIPGCGNAASWQAGIDLDGQDLAVGFVDDVYDPKWLAVVKCVMHKVQSPSDILLSWGNEQLLWQREQACV